MRYTEPYSTTTRLLSLAIRGHLTADEEREALRLYEAIGPARCEEAARLNQIEALTAWGLGRVVPGDALPPHWSALLRSNEARVLRLADTLAEIVGRLDRDGCRSACFEAGGVMLGTALPMAAYCSSDIDLLVDREHWELVQSRFAEAGFTPRDRRGLKTARIEFGREGADGTMQWLEVGTTAFDRMWIPLHYNDPFERWLGRRERARQHEGLWVLEPTDALVLVTMHTSLHAFVRPPGLRLYVDIDRLVRDAPIEWGRFLEEVRRVDITRRVATSLSVATEIVGTEVPRFVEDGLSLGRVRGVLLAKLLEQSGVAAHGRAKLGPLRTLMLDALVHPHSPARWASSVAFPPSDWLRTHFPSESMHSPSTGRLHLHRATEALRRWSPI